jgi:hypothetical protein
MNLFLIAFGIVSSLLFIMWIIIEKDSFLDNEIKNPWVNK